MGIRGLRSFIERNGILIPYCLQNNPVVIDGNNICHQLLYDGESRNFGGNYNLIKDKTKKFFEGLLRCNVKPYVVFDGAHDEDDKKLDDIMKKSEMRIKEFEEKVPVSLECFPVLVYESFTMTLKELGIPHVACDGEADNQIAVLAKQWRCPVISCDSDMYIFNLPGGFIHFNDLKIDMSTSGSLQTRLYLADKLKERLGIETNLLPLAATVLGNVYCEMDYNVVNRFFQRLGAKTSFKNLLKNLKYAFELLRNARDIETGLAILLQCVDENLPADKALNMKRKIDTSIRAFKTENDFTFFDIVKYFEGHKIIKPNKDLPDFVLESIRNCVLSGLPIDVAIGRVILKPTLEVFDQPPVQNICLPLRQIIYGIVCKSTKKDAEVTEIIRDKRRMVRKFVKPTYSIDEYGPVPTFLQIEHQNKEEKVRLLACIFEFYRGLNNIHQQSVLLALALNFFMKNTIYPASGVQLKSFVFCHVILLAKQNDARINILYKQFSRGRIESGPDLMIFHSYLQSFQECLNMTYAINALLGMPLMQPDPATVYDGPLMYNFFNQVTTEKDVDRLVIDSLSKDQSLVYRHLLDGIGNTRVVAN